MLLGSTCGPWPLLPESRKIWLLHVRGWDEFCFQNQAGSMGSITQCLGQIWFLPPGVDIPGVLSVRHPAEHLQGPSPQILSDLQGRGPYPKQPSESTQASSSDRIDSYTYCARCYSRCIGRSWLLFLAHSLKAMGPQQPPPLWSTVTIV